MIPANYKQAIDDFIEKIRNLEDYEVKPKYTSGILSFKSPVDFIVEKSAKEYIDCDYNEWVHIWLTKFGSKIWSVQNGNEVLTVGDIIKIKQTGTVDHIASFEIYGQNIIAIGKYFRSTLDEIKNLNKNIQEKTYTESDMVDFGFFALSKYSIRADNNSSIAISGNQLINGFGEDIIKEWRDKRKK